MSNVHYLADRFHGNAQIAAVLRRSFGRSDPVVGVVTQPDRPAGRGQTTAVHPCAKWLRRAVFQTLARKNKNAGVLDALRRLRPQIIVVVAYGRILPKTTLELAPHGCLTCITHFAEIPRGARRPLDDHQRGDEGGVTTMNSSKKWTRGNFISKKR